MKSTVARLRRIPVVAGGAIRNAGFVVANCYRLREIMEGYIDRRIDQRAVGKLDKTFAMSHSLQRLSPPDSAKAIAVVSCMPPARTGIASATLLTFQGASDAIDIFSPFDSSDDYIASLTHGYLTNRRVRIFDLQVLPFALRQNAYAAQLSVLGNSFANIPIVRALRRARFLAPTLPSFVHIHDPILWHLAKLLAVADGVPFRDILHQRYGVALKEVPGDEQMADDGICGARAVLGSARVDGVILNSRRAYDILAKEMPEEKLSRFFHPIFDIKSKAQGTRNAASNQIRIGTFGIPSSRKRTEVVIAAFREFRKSFPFATLVVAGYDARAYASEHRLVSSDGFEICDCEDQEFDSLMRSVDLAVQLRAVNWGESSGALARLLALDIPVITSPIGAFSEYGKAVSYFDQGGDAHSLAQLMTELVTGKSDYAEPRRRFREQHSPERFCQLLSELVERTALAV